MSKPKILPSDKIEVAINCLVCNKTHILGIVGKNKIWNRLDQLSVSFSHIDKKKEGFKII